MTDISYRGHRFPPIVIQHAVWLYLRFTLSYRDVEELLAERGLDVSYETVRSWVLKFGPIIDARSLSVRLETFRHRGTDGSQTRYWWGESRANQSLKWIFGGREIYGPIPRRLWDDAGSIRGLSRGLVGRSLVWCPSAVFSYDVVLSH
jgi:hypothetical protein